MDKRQYLSIVKHGIFPSNNIRIKVPIQTCTDNLFQLSDTQPSMLYYLTDFLQTRSGSVQGYLWYKTPCSFQECTLQYCLIATLVARFLLRTGHYSYLITQIFTSQTFPKKLANSALTLCEQRV